MLSAKPEPHENSEHN